MGEKIVLFAEEDTQFRLMETALSGKASEPALKALHYFFGANIEPQLDYLRTLPKTVGLPPGFRGVVCTDEKQLPSLIPQADYLVFERTEMTYELMKYGKGKLKLLQKFGSDYKNVDLKAAKELGIPVAYLLRVTTISVAEHVLDPHPCRWPEISCLLMKQPKEGLRQRTVFDRRDLPGRNSIGHRSPI